MKLTVTLLPGIAGILLLGSCNNSEYEGADIAGNKLTVTAGINELKTRVSESGIEWTVGDAIGVSDNLSSQPNLNIRYNATNTSGAFESSTGIYVLGSGETEYTAYYPYKGHEGASAGIVNFNITDAAGKYLGNDSTDYMFAKASANREDAKVNFRFDHKMSKLKLVIKNGESTEQTALSYTLKGVTTSGTFNTADGTVTPGADKGNVFVETTMGATSSVILPPTPADAQASSIDIIVKVGDKGYTGTITPALAASQEYLYTIDLSKIASGNFLKIDSPTISGWTSNDGGEVNMREDINYNPTLEVGDFICKDGSQIDKDYELTAALKQKIAGVVYYVGNPQPSVLVPEKYTSGQDILRKEKPSCTNGLAIALNNAQANPDRFATAKYSYNDWITAAADAASYIDDNMNTSTASSVMLGYNNTRIMEAAVKAENDNSKTGAENFINLLNNFRTSNAVENASDWYLPSLAELQAIKDNYAAVSASVQKAGGALPQFPDFATAQTESFYWSSDLRGNSYNWVSPLASTPEDAKLFVGRTSSGTKGYFRFAVAF